MSGIGARFVKFLALAAVALAATASSGTAASPGRTPILGIVPHTGQPSPAPHALPRAIQAAGPATLTFDPNYEQAINQYFTDVAAASGRTDNVYSVATQYYDNPGAVHVEYQSTFGGSYVDRNPLPRSGCSDGSDPYCLTDQQLENEIQAVLTATGWHGGLDHVFFLMTPNGVGSCLFASNAVPDCSTNAFCAYHSAFIDSNGENVIYANEPYEGPRRGCTDPSQGFPNGTDADTTINTISHEHNEAITNPLAPPLANEAWIAADHSENGDLCAYGFGAQTGIGVNAYNQVINGHHYDLQEEWSNSDGRGGGCVQRLGGPTSPQPQGDGSGPLLYNGGPVMHTNTTYAIYWLPTKLPAVIKAPHVSGRARVGKRLSGSHGSWTFSPTYRYQWLRCNAHGGSCSTIHAATHSTYKLTRRDSGHRLRLRVTAANAAGSKVATSAASARVHR